MTTKKMKQSNDGSTSEIKNDSTQSSTSKFTEKPQNNLSSSESGQQYEVIDKTPFAAIKQGDSWKIVIGNMIATPYDFVSKEDAEDYTREKPWELIWTTAVWLINNQEKFKIKKEE